MNAIGPYFLLSQIASGGMGDVYLARHRDAGESGQQVALKVIHPHLANNADFVARFVREAQTLRALRHPHIVEVFDAGNDGPNYFLAMEFVAGGSLQTRLDELRRAGQSMPLPEALNIARQMALALDYAHSKGFVHRDVKPSNILLRGDGSCVLTDFGIVLAQDQTRLTHTMQMIGTPAYMSPEQVRGQKLDRRADIYALGAVLYEMLSGSPPHTATDTPAMLYAIVNETVRPVGKLRAGLPAGVQRLVELSLAKDPDRRFQTGSQFVGALDSVSSPGASPKLNTPLPRPLPQMPQVSRRTIVATVALVVVLLLAVVAIAALQATRGNRQGVVTTIVAAQPSSAIQATATLVKAVAINTSANATATELATAQATQPLPTAVQPRPTDLPTVAPTLTLTVVPATQPPPTPAPTDAPTAVATAATTATTARPTGCITGLTQITVPTSGSVLKGQVSVTGTAACDGFVYYKFVFEDARCARSQCFVAGPRVQCGAESCPVPETDFTQPVTNGRLMTWDTTKFPNGTYKLALIAVGIRGGELPQRARILVTIKN